MIPLYHKPEVDWDKPFETLRKKWNEIPAGNVRMKSDELLRLSDDDLMKTWTRAQQEVSVGEEFGNRGWYLKEYKDFFNGKSVVDVGSGFGLDGIVFAKSGAKMTFADILESNLQVLQRLCKRFDINNAEFIYLEDFSSFAKLRNDYDVIWCQGSLINAPFKVIREEAQALLKHLKPNGRWIELAYPKARWDREGRFPFEEWGNLTDGAGTPWMEWYDLEKIKALLAPYTFEVIHYFEFHNSDFNWFDLRILGSST